MRGLAVAALLLAACGSGDTTASADVTLGDPGSSVGDAELDVDELDEDVSSPADAGPGAAAEAADSADAADAAAEAVPSTLAFPLDARGPLPVGYRSWEHTYTPEGIGEPRTVLLHAWYPAVEGSEGDNPVWATIFEDPHSIIDADARPPVDGVAYPVHVHSHGNRGFGASSSDLMSWFASHGWVAIAPDHIGDLLWEFEESEDAVHFLKRPQDISATLDALEGLPADDPLAASDTTRVVMSGHSRGTSTVWSVAGASYDVNGVASHLPDATEAHLAVFGGGFEDDRVVAAIPMAGTYRSSWFGTDGYLAIGDRPVLALTGSLDGHSSAVSQFESLVGIALTWVELEGGCHQTFALGFCDTLDPTEGFRLVGTYALAFARACILEDTAPNTLGVLDGTIPVSDLTTVQSRLP